jgi:hypothetical protein
MKGVLYQTLEKSQNTAHVYDKQKHVLNFIYKLVSRPGKRYGERGVTTTEVKANRGAG